MEPEPIHRRAARRQSGRLSELGEDLDVAVGEFLERYPDTDPSEIREAMRIAAGQTSGSCASVRWILLLVGAALTALVAGLVLAFSG